MFGKKLNPGEHNRILAAIFNNTIDNNYYDRGLWQTDNGYGQIYSTSQKALYAYWDEWLSLAGMSTSSYGSGDNYSAR